MIHITQGSINTMVQDGKLNFEVNHPDEWTYAKISVINKDNGRIDTTSATPNKKASISVYKDGEYWVEAKISTREKTSDAFDVVFVKDASGNDTPNIFNELSISEKPIIIVAIIFGIVAIVGLKIRK